MAEVILDTRTGYDAIGRYIDGSAEWLPCTGPRKLRHFPRRYVSADAVAFLLHNPPGQYRVNIQFGHQRIRLYEDQDADGIVIYRASGTEEALVEARLRGLL